MKSTLAALAALATATLPAAALPMRDLMDAPAAEVVTFKTTGTTALAMHLFRPAQTAPAKARPAWVWIHGGAWVGGGPTTFEPHARYAAARGAVGVSLTYRLAKPGQTTVADCLADCKSAIRYLRAHAAELGIDPARIAVAGDSAGGHLAGALGTIDGFDDPSDDRSVSARPDAMILYNPIVDMTEGDWIRFAVGGTALADKKSPRPDSPEAVATARALSPLFFVRPGQPPALVVHGLADGVVPAKQAERFAEAARAAGNRCELDLLEGVGHAFVVARYRHPESLVVDAIRRCDRFLVSLGWLEGEPTLEVSTPPAWSTPTPRK